MKFKLNKVFRFRKRVNRKYKDVLFRFIFRDKKDLLSLYNAINGTNYQNTEDLEINTLESHRVLSGSWNPGGYFAEKSDGGA